MTNQLPSPAALQALKEIAQISNLLCDSTCCEEHEKENWQELNKRLRLFRDDSFTALKSDPEPAELPDTVLTSANQLLSYVLTVGIRNTPEWMEGLCEQINSYAAATGEQDRVEPHRDSIRIIRAAPPEKPPEAKPPTCRDLARAEFKAAGLTYEDLTAESLSRLRARVHSAMQASDMFNKSFRCNQRFRTIGDSYSLKCRAYYFDDREAIVFYKSGFIGFAGWASDTTAKVITDAFVAWVNEMKSSKQLAPE